MKRKLWIMLTLAVIVGAVWCSAVGAAGEFTFITQPTEEYTVYKNDNTHKQRVDTSTELIEPNLLPVDEDHFPDAAFRQWVSDNADRNGNGWLSQDEIDATEKIYLNVPAFIKLASVQGIEYFTEITELIIENTPYLTNIDLSANTNITSLEITATGVTALDVRELPLKYLYCNNNALTSLTLGSQSNLTKLYCYGNPGIKTLDLRSCPYLLDAMLNGTMSVPDWGDLYESSLGGILYVDANTELIVPGCIRIDAAHFPDETFRDLIANKADKNGSGWLTPTEIAAVTDICFEDHDFATVQGIEYFTELETLCIVDANSLKSIDLRANTKLTEIDIANNGLTEINLNGLTALRGISCDGNPLISLTLGSLPNLVGLACCGTDLTTLDISGCPHLIEAYHGTKDTSNSDYDLYTATDCSMYVNKDMEIITGEAVMDTPDFVLPSALKTIEEEAFAGVRATVVYIPDGVTSIGANAFANCTSLTQMRIPNGCTIDRTAFSGCSAELTIFGTPGSDAQALAQENGYNFQIEW